MSVSPEHLWLPAKTLHSEIRQVVYAFEQTAQDDAVSMFPGRTVGAIWYTGPETHTAHRKARVGEISNETKWKVMRASSCTYKAEIFSGHCLRGSGGK